MKENTSIISLIHEIEQQLQQVYDELTLCRQYAWWMLEAITQKDKATLIAQQTISLSPQEQVTLDHWIGKQIDEHMPLQYLLGTVPFNGVEILVEPPVLIPRPETEEWTIKLIQQLKQLTNTKLTILDLCAGTGCIALAIAKAFPNATVYASDISDEALALAQKNAQHNNINNVTCIKSDLFASMPHNNQFDLIVSNPPYVAPEEWKNLDTSVTTWEDSQALIAQDEGLSIIKQIIQQAPHFIKANDQMQQRTIPQLVIEIGYKQGPKVVQLMKEAGFTNIQLHKDLERKDRVISGRVKNVAPGSNKK